VTKTIRVPTAGNESGPPALDLPPLRRLQEGIASLHPGYFALVMATGILSTATQELGMPWLSIPLLYIAAACYLVLFSLTALRVVRFPRRLLSDAGNPHIAFAFFTFVAGSNVLGLRLALDGQVLPFEVLAAVGAAVWLGLTYAIPVGVIVAPHNTRLPAAINGTWLIWVVGTQSVAAAAATLAVSHPSQMKVLAFLSVSLWAFGAILYLLLMAIITSRLVLGEISPEQLSPPYWVTMGATAITVFAAAHILSLPVRLPIPAATVSGLTFAFWAFGTWWIPLLVLLGLWRHLLKRVPLGYEPSLWSMVFPLGMYAAASQAFGRVAGLGGLEIIAKIEVWVALATWAATFAGMVVSLRKALR
jgi:tellurite resistance protein TehA-like permease